VSKIWRKLRDHESKLEATAKQVQR
jgi:hypothetical protein